MFWLLLFGFMAYGQTVEQFSEYGLRFEIRGAAAHNGGEGTNEFYGQYRSAIVGLRLSNKSELQTGITKSRVGNQEILEFPLLFRYQVSEKLSTYAGAQVQIYRGLDGPSVTPSLREFPTTIGVDYQFTKAWDTGIQFVIPVIENKIIPEGNFQLSHPIRLRTGVKF